MCVCVRVCVTAELFPIDTVPAVLWTLPSTDRHLGCCHGENAVFSVFHTTLWKSASTWASWQLMQGKSQPLVMLVYQAVSQIYKMRLITHKSCSTHASSDDIHVLYRIKLSIGDVIAEIAKTLLSFLQLCLKFTQSIFFLYKNIIKCHSTILSLPPAYQIKTTLKDF